MDFKKRYRHKCLLFYFAVFSALSAGAQKKNITDISKQELYYFWFNATQKNNFTGKQYKLDIDKEVVALESYIRQTKDFGNGRPGLGYSDLDQFDKKRMIDSAKREIRRNIAMLDYNKEYTIEIPFAGLGDYDFEKQHLEVYLMSNMDVGGDIGSFYMSFVNGMPIKTVYLKMGADKAEAIVKGLKGREVSKYFTYVMHFKVLPFAYEAKNKYIPNILAARLTKIEFFHQFYNDDTETWEEKTKFAEKISDPKTFPNPIIGTWTNNP